MRVPIKAKPGKARERVKPASRVAPNVLREVEERLATIAVCEFFSALGRLMRGKSGCNTAGRPPLYHESHKHRETRETFERYRITCNAPWRD